MAQNILITPKTSEPTIEFQSSGVGYDPITLYVLSNSNNDTSILSFEGSSGQLFSITDDLTGTIFAVGDISGLPLLSVEDSGIVKLAEYGTAIYTYNDLYMFPYDASGTSSIKFYELAVNGTNSVSLKAPASIASDVVLTLPNSAGSANQVLSTNGSGVLSWVGPGTGSTFESVSKNIKSYPYTLNYTGDKITSIVYNIGDGTITKTLNYSGDIVTSIVLSGDTPSGISLTKTLNYTDNILTSVSYS